MNVLSLFDGISCARIALERLNVPIDNYFASEIDPHAIKVSQHNYPDIIHLGDVRDIKSDYLPPIDLLIGGSPCQDLSHAQKGRGLQGEKSRLFYEYIRLYEALQPRHFLLENVKSKWADLMSEIVGVQHIEINASLFSAQSRPRCYWTNINYPALPSQPNHETMEDILVSEVEEKYFMHKEGLSDFLESVSFSTSTSKERIVKLFDLPKSILRDNERQRRIYARQSKSPTLLARSDTTKIYDAQRIRKLTPLECERLQKIPDNYTAIGSDTQRYKMIGNAFNVDTVAHILKGVHKTHSL
ncbi:MAG TPA: hypothetical protein ENK86_03990 [Campylobacterales bacterium]|nr:hypothetical protein [Campylobacterales bacterium]